MKTTNYLLYKKNFTPQLWAFLESKHCLNSFISNAISPAAYGVLSIDKNIVINQFETAFSFDRVMNTSRWLSLNEEWKKVEPSMMLSFQPDNKTKKAMHAKTIGIIVAMVIFVVSIIGVNTATDQYLNLVCTAVAFTCMCSIFCLLLSGPYPKTEEEQKSFTSTRKESWTKQ